jgi:hypothetical protein
VITHEELINLINYDPLSGIMTWKVERYKAPKGEECGWLTDQGYRSVKVLSKTYLVHRLAWFYMTSNWPKELIDHKNGNRTDNRFENLREATRQQNGRNGRRHKDNKCGYKGVRWHKAAQKWVAQIGVEGKRLHIGSFDKIEDAVDAYRKSAILHYGEFAYNEEQENAQ